MIGYLLDTNIVSEFSPKQAGRGLLNGRQLDWFEANEPVTYLSAVTVLEIEAGILKLGRIGPGRRQVQLAEWLDVLLKQMGDRILPMDVEVARTAAAVTDRNAAHGLNPGFPDIAIAATAIAYDLTLLTRNLRHFRASGAAVLDPFERLPKAP